jgi:uncharacterized repeat protein (TIGR02543 family)
MSSKFLTWALALVTAVAVSACGGGGSNGPSLTTNNANTGGSGGSPIYTLDATVTGAGNVAADTGTLTCTPVGNGKKCAGDLAAATDVTLSASASTGYSFSGWAGACTGKGTCKVKMSSAQSVQATFVADPVVSMTVTGSGAIASTPSGLACAGTNGATTPCSSSITAGTAYTLTATPASGYVFSGWTGDCTGSSTCSLTVDVDKTVTATFVPATQTLAVALTGSGAVAVSPAGQTCSGLAASCSYTLLDSSVQTLTATPASGYVFSGWGGDCAGTGTCSVTLSAAKSVTASFTAVQALSLTVSGSGTVGSSPAGVNCSGSCTSNLTPNGVYTLTATPATGHVFSGWGGACAGTGTCVVTMSAAKAVTASFASNLTLTMDVSGSGAISSSPSGLSCFNGTAPCSASLTVGSTYVLTATPNSGSSFTGWSGACTNTTGTCTVTMSAAKSVTANFTGNQTLSLAVTGSGSIASAPSGYTCATTTPCTSSVTTGNSYTFTATPATGYTFTGWSGGVCTGTGTCAVTMNAAKTLTANFTPNQTLTLAVLGSGSIASSPSGYNCSNSTTPCQNTTLTQGTALTLTATPATGYTFTGWSGACSGTSTCAVTLSTAQSVTATFTANQALTLAVVGSGSIASSPSGYSCATTSCPFSVTQGTALTLTATPATGYTFTGWSGGTCTGTGTCAVTLSTAKSVTATFTANQTLSLAVVGSGSIASSPSGYSCANTTTPCSATLSQGASLTLTATPATGYTFIGWSGACTGTGTCAVTLSAAQSVTATFTANQALTLAVAGSGSIASSPSGYSCATTSCPFSVTQGTALTLTATPATGYTFTGWSGGTCTGTGTCAVTLSTAKSVTATFALSNQTLSLTLAGSGTVSSAPTGVSCTATCAPSLTAGTAYTLTATPATGYTFTGWSGTGGCTGTGTCAVTMSAAQAVTATFTANQTLSLSITGTGAVSSSPTGVSCANTTSPCSASLTTGGAYTLTATPGTGYTFTGWGGACTGTGTCAVTMSAAKSVTATFTATSQTLSLTLAGSGTVSSSPTGVSCTASCAPSLTSGTAYTLTATPATGYTFTGWSGTGGCTGTSTCAVTMSAAKAVTATFTANQTLSLSITGTGSVSSSPTGVSCSNTTSPCSTGLTGGAAYTLTATPGTGYTFTGWGGACTGTGTCAVTMSAAKSVTATFTLTTQTLNLTMAGSGTVSSSPSGVSCTASCAPSLTSGAAYTLTATPASGYTFTGWSGACTGTSTCAVTMSAAQSVTATFTASASGTQTLSTTVSGTGSVISAGNISCTSGTCSAAINTGTAVTLTATPSTGWKLSAWSGACTGSTSTCAVTMSAAKTVTATFVVDTASAGCNITRALASNPPAFAASHPKVFLNHAQTLSCLQGMATANLSTYATFKAYVDREVNTQLAAGVTTYTYFGFESWHAALLYRITGDTKYRDFAISRADVFVTSEEALITSGTYAHVAFDNYLYSGPLLGDVALVYDWCYDGMTPTQRTRWVSYLNQAVNNIWHETTATWGGNPFPWSGWANTDPYNNYHYSFLRATMLVGLATKGDNSRAQEWIDMFRTTKIENDLVPLFNANLAAGGSLEGTTYGVALKELFEVYDWWERSTGERIADKTTHTLGSQGWMMHQTTPDGIYLVSLGDQSRDHNAWFFDYNREYMLKLIALYPQERLSSVANLMLNGSTLPTMTYGYESVWDFIYRPPTLVAANLTDTSSSWYGAGTGDYMMRSSWGDKTATYAMIKCGWLAESHQHLEQGAFQIYRGDWLAPTGSRYSKNGLQNEVGVNNLVRFVDGTGTDVQQTDAGGNAVGYCDMAALGGDDNYNYALTKVTPLYHNNGIVSKSEREFVFIKPSTFVVFDRAVTTSPTYKRVWTFNVGDSTKTTINGNQLTYVGPTSNRVDLYRVAPAGLSYQLVSYPWASWNQDAYFPNAQRVDVLDTGSSATSYFLHVIGTSTSSTASGISSVVTPTAISGMTGVTVNMTDGKVATLYFSNTGTGGTIEIKSAAGAVISTGALPTTVTVPPLFKN